MDAKQLVMYIIMIVLGALAFYYSRRASDAETREYRLQKELEQLKKEYKSINDQCLKYINAFKDTEEKIEKLRKEKDRIEDSLREIELKEYLEEIEREEAEEKAKKRASKKK